MSASAALAIARSFPPVIRRLDLACDPSLVPDPDVFFDTDVAAAIRVCRRCPARHECSSWAVETRQNTGVWGATTPRDRNREYLRRHPQ